MLNGAARIRFKVIGNKFRYDFSALLQAGASAYLEGMKDLNALMQQAQAMQQKLQDAQAKMAETAASGSSGGGLVTVALKGACEITAIKIDDSLLSPGEGEILADLIVAAHADA